MNPEHWISLPDAAKRLPGNPSIDALLEWVTSGLVTARGDVVALEAFLVGDHYFTTLDNLDRFVLRQIAASQYHNVEPSSGSPGVTP